MTRRDFCKWLPLLATAFFMPLPPRPPRPSQAPYSGTFVIPPDKSAVHCSSRDATHIYHWPSPPAPRKVWIEGPPGSSEYHLQMEY